MEFDKKIKKTKDAIPKVDENMYKIIYRTSSNAFKKPKPKYIKQYVFSGVTAVLAVFIFLLTVINLILPDYATGPYAKVENAIKNHNFYNKYIDTFNFSFGFGAMAPAPDDVAPEGSEVDDDLTRNQSEGVKENDIIRKDGEYIYYLSLNQSYSNKTGANIGLVTAKLNESDSFIVSVLPIPYIESDQHYLSNDHRTTNLFIYNDYAIVLASSYEKTYTYFVDITEKENPVIEKVLHQKGLMKETRMIDDLLYIFSSSHVNVGINQVIENYIPYFDSGDGENLLEPEEIVVPDFIGTNNFLTIGTIDLDIKEYTHETAVLGAAAGTIYVTLENIVIATAVYDVQTDRISYLHRARKTQTIIFDIDNIDIESAKIIMIDGSVNDRFSINIKDEYLRIATSSLETHYQKSIIYRTTPSGEKSNVYIYNLETSEKVGEIVDFAPANESIRSAHYDDDILYVVTYFLTDPVYVIDLSVPTDPVILSQTEEIPGFSTYLYSFGEYLIGFGYIINWSGFQVSVYGNLSESIEELDKLEFENSMPHSDKNAYYIDEDNLTVGFAANDYDSGKFNYYIYRFDGEEFVLELVTEIGTSRSSLSYYGDPEFSAMRLVKYEGYYYLFTNNDIYVITADMLLEEDISYR